MVLKELCLLRGVSGDEGRVRDFIKSHIEAHADRTWTDILVSTLALITCCTTKKPIIRI